MSDYEMRNQDGEPREPDKAGSGNGRRPPQLIPGRLGTTWFSLSALLERVLSEFVEEFGNDSSVLLEADTATKRLKLLRDIADYVLAVESVQLSAEHKAELLTRAYSDLFGYGPLDAYFLDERVTTIAIEGLEKAAVRYGHGDLVPVGPLFLDQGHLARIIARLLTDAGAELREDQPYLETGLTIDDRPVCISIVAPPITLQLSADIRVHVKQLPAVAQLVESGFMTFQAAQLLEALVKSPHGFVLVGDTESGKTTLLSALSHWLLEPQHVVSVERAGELRLPTGVQRLIVRWPSGNVAGISFGQQIAHALEKQPACILLDEVRSDEPHSIAPLLEAEDAPRQIWSVRGPVDTKRLRNALGMLARRADVGRGEELVYALYQRLPFVVTVKRAQGRISLRSIAEWQIRSSDFPDYVLLMETEDGVLRLTGERPSRTLDLPDAF